MGQYWCVNFDSDVCLKHGIKNNLWMMQYQYRDEFGNRFQRVPKGGKESQKVAGTENRSTAIRNASEGGTEVPHSTDKRCRELP